MKRLLLLTAILVAPNIYSNELSILMELKEDYYSLCSARPEEDIRDAIDIVETCVGLSIEAGYVPYGDLMTHEGWLIQPMILKEYLP